jgi:hypothetical protein
MVVENSKSIIISLRSGIAFDLTFLVQDQSSSTLGMGAKVVQCHVMMLQRAIQISTSSGI